MAAVQRTPAHPHFSPYVSGLDPEAQNESIINDPRQHTVKILEPVGLSTGFCVNFGNALISLFSSFLLLTSVLMLTLGAWMMHKKQTTASHIILYISILTFVISLLIAFRNICFRGGNISSIIALTIVCAATLFFVMYLTIAPGHLARLAGRLDQTKAERMSSINLDPKTHPATPPATSPTTPPSTLGGIPPYHLERVNLGKFIDDQRTVLLVVGWVAAVFQLLTIGYLIYTFKEMNELQVLKKVAVVDN